MDTSSYKLTSQSRIQHSADANMSADLFKNKLSLLTTLLAVDITLKWYK